MRRSLCSVLVCDNYGRRNFFVRGSDDECRRSLQAFVAAALMEYAGDGNDRVARNIFELGLEQFMAAPGYVLQYADFLIGLADLHNTCALFERALGETPPAASKPLWDRYIQVTSKPYHPSVATSSPRTSCRTFVTLPYRARVTL